MQEKGMHGLASFRLTTGFLRKILERFSKSGAAPLKRPNTYTSWVLCIYFGSGFNGAFRRCFEWRSVAMIAPALLVIACSSWSQAELDYEVSQLAPIGSDVATAISRAGAAGFVCEQSNPTFCIRPERRLLGSCADSFYIRVGENGHSVGGALPTRIVCLGL